jgi:hypothetical protein
MRWDRWRSAHGRVLWKRHLWVLPHLVATSSVEALLRRAPGRRRRADVAGQEDAVYFLFNDAFFMGGTMRTAFGLAGHLAPPRPVTLVSVFRGDDTPFFAFPDGVALRVLDDRRGGERRSALRRAPGRVPSVLTHPLDFSFRLFTLYTDFQLLRFVRSLRAGTIIATRTSLALFVARFARPELTLVAQEHFHLSLYPPALRAEILRMYPRLDALGVLTRADEQAYRVLSDRGLKRLARIPNPVPELPGAVADARG